MELGRYYLLHVLADVAGPSLQIAVRDGVRRQACSLARLIVTGSPGKVGGYPAAYPRSETQS